MNWEYKAFILNKENLDEFQDLVNDGWTPIRETASGNQFGKWLVILEREIVLEPVPEKPSLTEQLQDLVDRAKVQSWSDEYFLTQLGHIGVSRSS